MKRTISLLTVLLIVFSLSACKKNQNQPTETDRSNIVYVEKGEGKNSFYLDLSLQSGEKHYKINTNETTVGSALEKLGIFPDEIDNELAMIKLRSLGIEIDTLTEEQYNYIHSWQEGT